jgi:hypothetical protein
VSREQDKAADAIFRAIQRRAKSADGEEIEQLGKGFSEVVHGAHGGAVRSETSTDYRYSTDEHQTNHEGESRGKPTGFAS